MPAEVPLPKIGEKAHICVWFDFTLKHLDELKCLQDVGQAKRKIAEVLGLDETDANIKKDILVDLFYFAYRFGRDCNFNEEQLSAFLSIIKRTHNKAMDSPFGNIDAAHDYFKELLLRHCVKRPPFSVQLYNMAEAKKISDYILDTYFKHYKLYKYAFTPKIRLNLSFEYNGLPEEPEEKTEQNEEGDMAADVEIAVPAAPGAEESEQEEIQDPPAVKELKTIINSTLTDQVQKLKTNMEEQLKSNEESLLKKISEATGGERGPSRKSRKK